VCNVHFGMLPEEIVPARMFDLKRLRVRICDA